MQRTSIHLLHSRTSDLRRRARARGYTQSRGVGAGEAPSVSQFIDALGAGELVAIGPVMAWRDVISALEKVSAADLTDREREVIETIRDQVLTDADFSSDDL